MSSPERPVRDDSGECAMTREVARMLVHDLRAPLTAIAGYAEMLRRAANETERDEMLSGLGRAVKRMDQMLDDALRGEFDNTAPPGATRVDLLALVSESAADARAASGREVLVTGTAADVLGDELLLRRAIDNLIGNAVKYSPEDAVVDIVVASGTDGSVIEVRDRGRGIPAEERERVLLPFERLERDSKLPGTGLGLAVVASVAERHGGTVALADREGGGTVARIALPPVPNER